MPDTSTGKAFEYACLETLRNALDGQEVRVEHNQAYVVARNFFDQEDQESQNEMILAAEAGLRIISRLEPQIHNGLNNTPIYLSLQEDAQGMAGDVRDLLCIRLQNEWEIGISCKHNHSAVKHSRLSQTIDFGLQWFGIPCSRQYFEEITPIFDELKRLKTIRATWRDIADKDIRVYRPLLTAFITELQRLYDQNGEVIPNRLLSYLIGRHDFYKLIDKSSRRSTHIQAFNMFGTLNRNAGQVRVNNVPRTPLPQAIYNMDFNQSSNNTISIVCNNGWTVSLRIHNASTNVEPSLKFDVNLIGVPQDLFSHDEPWGE